MARRPPARPSCSRRCPGIFRGRLPCGEMPLKVEKHDVPPSSLTGRCPQAGPDRHPAPARPVPGRHLPGGPDAAPGPRTHARPAREPVRDAPGLHSGTDGHPALPFGFSGYGRRHERGRSGRAGHAALFPAAASQEPAPQQRRDLAASGDPRCRDGTRRAPDARPWPGRPGGSHPLYARHGPAFPPGHLAGEPGQLAQPAVPAPARRNAAGLLHPPGRAAAPLVRAHPAQPRQSGGRAGKPARPRRHAGPGRGHAAGPAARHHRARPVALLDGPVCGRRPDPCRTGRA